MILLTKQCKTVPVWVAVGLLMAAVVCAAAAQENKPSENGGPSLQTTLDWLKTNIEAHANGGTDGPCPRGWLNARPCSWNYVPIQFNGCQVSWSYMFHVTAYGRALGGKRIITVPLYEQVTATAQSQNYGGVWEVELTTRDDQRKIRIESFVDSYGEPEHEVYNSSKVVIEFGSPTEDNKDIANRVSKAFARAIDLCQSEKPKNTEPF